MRVAFYTLGCKTNQFETQGLEQLFSARGHEIVPFSENADAYIVNTCTVTALADKKSRAACRRAKRLSPKSTLIVCGCYSQASPEKARELCGADFVLGTTDKARAVELAEHAYANAGARAIHVRELWRGDAPKFEALPAGGPHGRTRALLKVQDGCENFCSYCYIPFARGPCRSMPLDSAVREAEKLAEDGYCEVVITGIEISSWGRDLPGSPPLYSLIEAICRAVPTLRVRLSSLEPRTASNEFAKRLSGFSNLCPHFHLSLQSGCDKTLRAMNRKYSTQQYYESCEILRSYFPGCAITTDLIVGFPGESEQDFAESLEFIQRCRLARTHIFPFSAREGTRAAGMHCALSRAEKEARAARAQKTCDELEIEFLDSQVGKVFDVLYEQPEGRGFSGLTPNYARVCASGKSLRNKIYATRIISREGSTLAGEIICKVL